MTLSNAYLNRTQHKIWSLRRIGFRQVDIAKKLGITRQAVNKTVGTIDENVQFAMNEIATLNQIKPRYMSTLEGIMIGHSRRFDVDAVVTLSDSSNLQIWYSSTADCDKCKSYAFCRSFLMSEAKRRNVNLSKDEKKLQPSRIAKILFARSGDFGGTK
ncbi:MAG TPA: hypothetical protein VE862_11280 [Candidatus Acidoferrum sp.]|nr:hypothetical protein [Candidatus Acidoferrum sp.]